MDYASIIEVLKRIRNYARIIRSHFGSKKFNRRF